MIQNLRNTFEKLIKQIETLDETNKLASAFFVTLLEESGLKEITLDSQQIKQINTEKYIEIYREEKNSIVSYKIEIINFQK